MTLVFALPKTEAITLDALARANYDVFLSAYNPSNRLTSVFESAQSERKWWFAHREYGLSAAQLPTDCLLLDGDGEAAQILSLCDNAGLRGASKVCIDITGIMPPHLMVLLVWLYRSGRKAVDFLYSEPRRYTRDIATEFSRGRFLGVRQVEGLTGTHEAETDDDVLVIGTGYDAESIIRVADSRDYARKVPLYGLPSLRPQMYQENRLQAYRAREALGHAGETELFAAAYDPWETAEIVCSFVGSLSPKKRRNIYLAPLGTKAQVLGFAAAYLYGMLGPSVSVVYPFRESYSPETSVGMTRLWRYRLEFELMARICSGTSAFGRDG